MKAEMTWREAIAAQNTSVGIKATPNPRRMEVDDTAPRLKAGREPGNRVRHITGEMNGLEKRYAAFLEQRRMCGEIASWKFEGIKLKLAKATFYNVDFMVVMPDGSIELHETKGFWEDDARVKSKVAIEMFTEFKFVTVKWNKNTKGWEFK